ncbi:MAG: cellulase family glycosylhydrolase [Anaerolineae bacterium]|nr:cellulase family glycosylhydrolase [Anaerolineae bacterium]
MTFKVTRGTNISHWLSQSQRRGAERCAFFTQADVHRIAELGRGKLDHIRLPIDEEQMWDKVGDRQAEAFDLLDAALDWCEEAGLKVIVDLHLLRTHHFLDEEEPLLFSDPREEGRFAGLWRELSAHLDDRSTDSVAYELLNEAVARDPEDWNRVAKAAYHAIREQEPERTIVLGSNWFNQHHTFRDLYVPEDDDLILTFHYYFPMFITHYTAPWWADGGAYSGPIRYPGKPIARKNLAALDDDFRKGIKAKGLNRSFGREAMVEDLVQPLAVREETRLPLYCGEFGCFDRTPAPLRRAWYRDILSVFRQYDIAWANWDYKGSFGIVDQDGNPTAVANVLLGD